MGLVIAEVEHLSPVALGTTPAKSNVEQLLMLWRLCQPAASPQQLGSFAIKVKRQLACFPEAALLMPIASNSRHPTLGSVYGKGFAVLVAKFLQLDPSGRNTFHDLHDRCCQRLKATQFHEI
jgi:hypothetical protein